MTVDSTPTTETTPTPTWEAIAAAKVAGRDALIPADWRITVPEGTLNVLDIPRTCGVLAPEEVKITETPAVDLIAAMSTGKLTSVAVTTAFCKRAALAQQLTNCLTEIRFTEGIKAAAAIDAEFAKTGKPIGPLHGLPISLKDNVGLAGVDGTTGFITYANKPAEEDADLVKTIVAAGAVVYCKTNVPTGMLMAETYNNVWGYTSNPYNAEFGCGGSSGGEGSLIAQYGSPLGVGTDIGGSVRMPAASNGIFGLKPAGGRLSSQGLRAGLPGQEAVKSVSGPMSNDLASLELYVKVILDGKPWERDPAVFNMPWRDVVLPEKLCFGLILDDGIVKPTPAVTRVLLETKAALEAAGHTVIEWTPYDAKGGNDILFRFLLGDGGATMREQVRTAEVPEPWPRNMELFEHFYNMFKDKPPTVADLWKLQTARQVYLRKMLQGWYATKDVSGTGRPMDGVISPVTAFPSCPRYTFKHAGYTALWNMADMTSCAFPAGFANKNDTKTGDEELRNDDEKDVWDKYDPERVDGMPVGLQVIVTRHHEEEAMKLAGVAHEALKAYRK